MSLPAWSQAGLAAAIARSGPLAYRAVNAGSKGKLTLPKVPGIVHELGFELIWQMVQRQWFYDRQNQIIISLDGESWRRFTPASYCVIEPAVAPQQCFPCDLTITPSGDGANISCNKHSEPPLTVTCSTNGCSFPDYEARRKQDELDRQAAQDRVIQQEQEIRRQEQERALLLEQEKNRFLARARCAADQTQNANFSPYSAKLVSTRGDSRISAYNYPGISDRSRSYKATGNYITVLFDVARLDPPVSIRTAPRLLCVSMESSLYNTVEYFYVDRANVVQYVPNRFERAFHDQ